jgi:hypothetical protein
LREMTTEGVARLAARLRSLRGQASRQPDRWVGTRTDNGLVVAWRAGPTEDELRIERPLSVVFEPELRMIVDAVREQLGLAASRRRVLGRSIVVTLERTA